MQDRNRATGPITNTWPTSMANCGAAPLNGHCSLSAATAVRPGTVEPRRIKPNKRQLRALRALLAGDRMREDFDRLAGCSNGPDLIARLRKLGAKIDCVHVDSVNRDGKPCKSGRYSLTREGRLVDMQLVLEA